MSKICTNESKDITMVYTEDVAVLKKTELVYWK